MDDFKKDMVAYIQATFVVVVWAVVIFVIAYPFPEKEVPIERSSEQKQPDGTPPIIKYHYYKKAFGVK